MMISVKNRIDAKEELDDFELFGEELEQTLEEIAGVNQMLGGNRISIKAVKTILGSISTDKHITIVDVGCGNGDMLRSLAKMAKKHNMNVELLGIDANPHAINIAKELSSNFENLSYNVINIFDEEFGKLKYDIALCTLTLHHFKDDEISDLMRVMCQNTSISVIVNDLHRSRIAYYLFKLYSWVFKLGPISKADGLTSILRGFKKEELQSISRKLQLKTYSIQWKWAFRYLWIIKTGNTK